MGRGRGGLGCLRTAAALGQWEGGVLCPGSGHHGTWEPELSEEAVRTVLI